MGYGSMTTVQTYVPGCRSLADAVMSSPGPAETTLQSMVEDVPPGTWLSTDTLRLVSGVLAKFSVSPAYGSPSQVAKLSTVADCVVA